jgi:hypothetical protein
MNAIKAELKLQRFMLLTIIALLTFVLIQIA